MPSRTGYEHGPRLGTGKAILVNLLVLLPLAYGAVLHAFRPDLYYLGLQEDEYVEWASFWSFALVAAAFVVGAIRQHRASGRWPWFLLGVALFCFVVAMEEISWGQRVFGYRPPAYFLEHNFQQELNVHNVLGGWLRKFSVKGAILGYGVLLPLVVLIPVVRRLFSRAAVVVPPPSLVPAFFATFLTYQVYPWKFSGELVEMMFGSALLFAAYLGANEFREEGTSGRRVGAVSLVAAYAVLVGLGFTTAATARLQRGAHPANVEAARTEVQALREDFLTMAARDGGEPVTRCNLSKRLYSYVEKYHGDYLLEGAFAGLTAQGLPEARAEFFLDPWNQPYWVRDRCNRDVDERRVFVYSFGPNRRRDSTRWDILGDDVGAMIFRFPEGTR